MLNTCKSPNGNKFLLFYYIAEPNILDEVSNISISAEQLAHDFISLRKLLDSLGMQNSVLAGPDVTNPTPGSSAAPFLQR